MINIGLLLFALMALAGYAKQAVVLRMGDQKVGNQALLRAAGELPSTGYQIEWKEFPAAEPLLEALNGGALDAGYVGGAPFFFAFATGLPARAIGAVEQNGSGLAVVVPARSALRAVNDLKGRRVGTGRGSVGHFLILASLEHAGIALKDIDVVFLKPVDARAALDHGSIDAWATWEPYTSILELSENARILTDGRALPPQHDYVVARTDSLGGGKRAALDYLHRLYRAQNWALQHPDVFAQVWDNLTGVPPDLAKRWFRRAQPHNVPIDSKLIAGEQNVIDLYARAGVIQHRFQVADAFDRLLNK